MLWTTVAADQLSASDAGEQYFCLNIAATFQDVQQLRTTESAFKHEMLVSCALVSRTFAASLSTAAPVGIVLHFRIT
jgi:hypothetical protein